MNLLGPAFVRYVLSIGEETATEGLQLSPPQAQVASVALNWMHLDQSTMANGMDTYFWASPFSQYLPDQATSVVNLFRRMTGGVIEVAEPTGDVLVDSIADVAADVWPIYLLRPSGDGPRTFWMSSPVGAYNHPSLGRATEAFVGDADLMKLFPYAPSLDTTGDRNTTFVGMGYQSLIITNGPSGSLQMSSLISGLISTAVFRLLIAGEQLGLHALTQHLSVAVADLRRLARGEEVQVPTLVGLAGVRLADSSDLILPAGRLRPATPTDRELFMSGATSFETVYVTSFATRIYSVKEHKFEDGDDPLSDIKRYEPRITEAHRAFTHSLDLVRLALLLASPPSTPWLARETARYVADLTSHGGSVSWDPTPVGLPLHDVPADEYETVQGWHSWITRKHMPSLDIGVRRLLSAATMRTDPIDGFVDAVICWESLFGVQTETTFRVTGSIAKLLEPENPRGREALQRELKGLYAKRSRLVHGGPEPSPEEAIQLRQRAIDVATDCLRIFYRDRDDLIGLASDARGARVLLE